MFDIHNLESAPETSQKLLSQIQSQYGFLPNLMGVMAESTPVLESYVNLGQQLEKSSFTPQEIQVLYLAINYENECPYCMAAHSMVAKSAKVPPHILEALRTGQALDDPKLNALATFAKKVVQERGWVQEDEAQLFLKAGFTKANILEVILGVAHKTISNYINHINETPVDKVFESQTWSKK